MRASAVCQIVCVCVFVLCVVNVCPCQSHLPLTKKTLGTWDLETALKRAIRRRKGLPSSSSE